MIISERNAYLLSVATDADVRRGYFGAQVADRIATIAASTYVNGNGGTVVSAWDIATTDGAHHVVRVGETLPASRDTYRAARFEHYRAMGEDYGTANEWADADTNALAGS